MQSSGRPVQGPNTYFEGERKLGKRGRFPWKHSPTNLCLAHFSQPYEAWLNAPNTTNAI